MILDAYATLLLRSQNQMAIRSVEISGILFSDSNRFLDLVNFLDFSCFSQNCRSIRKKNANKTGQAIPEYLFQWSSWNQQFSRCSTNFQSYAEFTWKSLVRVCGSSITRLLYVHKINEMNFVYYFGFTNAQCSVNCEIWTVTSGPNVSTFST